MEAQPPQTAAPVAVEPFLPLGVVVAAVNLKDNPVLWDIQVGEIHLPASPDRKLPHGREAKPPQVRESAFLGIAGL